MTTPHRCPTEDGICRCHAIIPAVCAECGGPVDPDVTHPRHAPDCPKHPDGWGIGWDCQCPEVCAACCTDAGCPTRTPQETPDG